VISMKILSTLREFSGPTWLLILSSLYAQLSQFYSHRNSLAAAAR
jgi:hypothetical protein